MPALGSTQLLKMSTKDLFWGEGGRCIRLRPATLVVPNVKKIRDLNLPRTPWAISACCGRPLPFYTSIYKVVQVKFKHQHNGPLSSAPRPSQCVIAQQYSSTAFVSLHFQSSMENFDATFKNLIISIFQIF